MTHWILIVMIFNGSSVVHGVGAFSNEAECNAARQREAKTYDGTGRIDAKCHPIRDGQLEVYTIIEGKATS
jgi:hypothetical protein